MQNALTKGYLYIIFMRMKFVFLFTAAALTGALTTIAVQTEPPEHTPVDAKLRQVELDLYEKARLLALDAHYVKPLSDLGQKEMACGDLIKSMGNFDQALMTAYLAASISNPTTSQTNQKYFSAFQEAFLKNPKIVAASRYCEIPG